MKDFDYDDIEQDFDFESGLLSCSQCNEIYDEIDFEYQICHKCGWDAGNNIWTKQ